jgi:uncharacterized protein
MWRHALWSTRGARAAGDADRNQHAATLASPIDVGPCLLNLGHRLRRFPQHASYRTIFPARNNLPAWRSETIALFSHGAVCEYFVTRRFLRPLSTHCDKKIAAYCLVARGRRQTRAVGFTFEAITMANFTPISAAIGGALIGLSAVLLMMLNGRIAGITGVFAGLIDPIGGDRAWRATFIAGLIAAPLSAVLLGLTLPLPQMPSSLAVTALAGLLVGFGTRLSNGCTSGHGVCGIARLSPRSIAATAIFMAAAIAVVALTRHVFGA